MLIGGKKSLLRLFFPFFLFLLRTWWCSFWCCIKVNRVNNILIRPDSNIDHNSLALMHTPRTSKHTTERERESTNSNPDNYRACIYVKRTDKHAYEEAKKKWRLEQLKQQMNEMLGFMLCWLGLFCWHRKIQISCWQKNHIYNWNFLCMFFFQLICRIGFKNSPPHFLSSSLSLYYIDQLWK